MRTKPTKSFVRTELTVLLLLCVHAANMYLYMLKTNKKETLNRNHYHDICRCRYIENKMNADECGMLSHTRAQTRHSELVGSCCAPVFSSLFPLLAITCIVANILMMVGDHHQLENDFTDIH